MATLRDFRELQDALRAQGWTLTRTNGSHYKATSPDGRSYHYAESRDPRAILNTVSDLRKLGFHWPPLGRAKPAPLSLERCPGCGGQTFDPAKGSCSVCEAKRCKCEAPELASDALRRLLGDVTAAKELLAEALGELDAAAVRAAEAERALQRAKTTASEAKAAYDAAKTALVAEL